MFNLFASKASYPRDKRAPNNTPTNFWYKLKHLNELILLSHVTSHSDASSMPKYTSSRHTMGAYKVTKYPVCQVPLCSPSPPLLTVVPPHRVLHCPLVFTLPHAGPPTLGPPFFLLPAAASSLPNILPHPAPSSTAAPTSPLSLPGPLQMPVWQQPRPQP